jgi:hypothetical protein
MRALQELLQMLRCRFDCLCCAEHFLLDEVADAPRRLRDEFALWDGMIDSTGRQVVMARQSHGASCASSFWGALVPAAFVFLHVHVRN